MMVADVTESQQAIVRVTPADGMQPFTMQSKEDRKKDRKKERKGEHGRKKTRGEKLITITSKEISYGKSVCSVFPRELKEHKTQIHSDQGWENLFCSIHVG